MDCQPLANVNASSPKMVEGEVSTDGTHSSSVVSSRLTVTAAGEETRVKAGLKRTYDLFAQSHKYPLPPLLLSKPAHEIKVLSKVVAEYKHVRDIDTDAEIIQDTKIAVSLPGNHFFCKRSTGGTNSICNVDKGKSTTTGPEKAKTETAAPKASDTDNVLEQFERDQSKRRDTNPASAGDGKGSELVEYKKIGMPELEKPKTRALQIRENIARQRGNFDNVKPKWHAPWKLFRVIAVRVI